MLQQANEVSDGGTDIGAFGGKLADQPETRRAKIAHDKQANVAAPGRFRGACEQPAEILGGYPVLRMPVERGIDSGGGENCIRRMAVRPDDFRKED